MTEEATLIIPHLVKHNIQVEDSFNDLQKLSKDCKDYDSQLLSCALISSSEWVNQGEVGLKLFQLRKCFNDVRHYLKRMGECASVDIEPPTQTRLIDATMMIPGVLIGGVPGAGGFDAIFALTLSQESIQQIERLWTQHEPSVLPLLVRENRRGVSEEVD